MSTSNHNFQFTFRSPVAFGKSLQKEELTDALCNECEQLDLEQSFINAFRLYEGARRGKVNRPLASCRKGNGPVYIKDFYYVSSLGHRLSRTANCKLCRFLAHMTTEPEKGPYKLLAFCSSESYLFEPRKKDVRGRMVPRPWEEISQNVVDGELVTRTLIDIEHNVFMAIVPEIVGVPRTGVPIRWFETELPKNGSIYRLSAPELDVDRLVLPRELAPQANFTLMRAWLGRCRCSHKTCGPRKPAGTSLPGFRLINCWKINRKGEHPVEVRPWSDRYVALSYVWGPPSGDWPATIKDAAEVTRKLGERYLWVDRLCIDQSNLEEKMELISKMDDIYGGAEFTIVCAAGDARTGLPGVNNTPRRPQPRVELSLRSANIKGKAAVRNAPDFTCEMLGVAEEDYDMDRIGETAWLDTLRFGLKGEMAVDFGELLKDGRLMKEYNIPKDHLEWYQDFAKDLGTPIEEFLDKMKELSRRMCIPFKELVPHLAGGNPFSTEERLPTHPSKPEKPLPPNRDSSKLVLVSSMQEPRKTIKDSEWATRGWTYQEGVLSNRRLVFTEQQTYWECCAMAVCETIKLPLNAVHNQNGERMTDIMLSGIFDDDLHRDTELQYGFAPSSQDDIGEKILTLDSHIQAFTSRKLTNNGDSLKAFLGIAAHYKTDTGLLVLLGLPIWTGALANGAPGLQHTFALSVSSWTHIAARTEDGVELYVADCPRRSQFPSWTWAGWQGPVEFCNEKQSKFHKTEQSNGLVGIIKVVPDSKMSCGDDTFDVPAADPAHSDFFKALTDKAWVSSVNRIWSAEMVLHNADGTEETLLAGWAPVWATGDPNKLWLLTIQKPLVLRHMHLVHSAHGGSRRLMGKAVKMHLSVPMTEAGLTAGHKNGDLVTVLVFASTVPYVWNGIARFLILRKAGDAGDRWERIGRMNLWLSERDMGGFTNGDDMITSLPVKALGKNITIR